MKTIISIAPLIAGLSMFAHLTAFGQVGPAALAPEAANAPRHADKLHSMVYSAQVAPVSSRDSVPPVILQFTSADQNATASLEEDLSVMTRLIEKSLEQSLGENSPAYKMGIPMLVTSSGRSVRAMYLEGFGATFMIKVNFPVLAPPTVEEKKPEQTSDDSEWERTRKELSGIREPGDSPTVMVGAEVAYDPALVETLKKELLETLKNASNIRGLKAEEFVCVTVFGSPNATFGKRTNRSLPGQQKAPANRFAGRGDTKSELPGRPGAAVVYYNPPASQGTVLTLRVKKSDVDAFEKGKLDFKAFEKAARFNAYPGSGYDVTSVNSWSRPTISYGSSRGGSLQRQ